MLKLKYLFIIAAFLGTGVLAYYFYYRNKKGKKRMESKINGYGKDLSISGQTVFVQIPVSSQSTDTSNVDKCDIESWPFNEDISLFKNEVGGLWLLANQKSKSLSRARLNFKNISTALERKGTSDQQKWWNNFIVDMYEWTMQTYQIKSAKLLRLLQFSGLSFEKETEVTWDSHLDFFYYSMEELNMGQKCKIIIPLSLYNDVPFEKGLVKPF